MSVLHRLPLIVHQHVILSPLATPYPTGGQGGWDVMCVFITVLRAISMLSL